MSVEMQAYQALTAELCREMRVDISDGITPAKLQEAINKVKTIMASMDALIDKEAKMRGYTLEKGGG